MNRLIFLLIFSSIICRAYSQEPKWMVYPSIGINMGGAIPIPLSSIPSGSKGTPKLTPSLGIGFQYSIAERWNLALDVNYHILSFTGRADVISQSFWSDDRSYVLYFSGEVYTNTELRFVEFPLSAYFKLGENWSLIFGAYYSLILEGRFETEGKNGWISADKEDTDNAPLPGTQSTTYNFSDDLDNYDFGGFIGYQYKITPRVLFWGCFYFGFKNIFKSDFQNIDYKMYQLRLNTGISYVLFHSKV